MARSIECVMLLILLGTASAGAQTPSDDPRVIQLGPRLHAIVQRTANLLVLTDDEGTFVAGVPYTPLIARARTLVDELHAPPIRYALIMEDDSSLVEGDGGLGAPETTTFVQEKLYGRLYGVAHPRRKDAAAPQMKHPTPKIGFSDVIQILLKREDVHVIHARSGYTDADVIVHFEGSGVVYLGNTFTSDGYPAIDTTRRGDVNGIITTSDVFISKAAAFPETVATIVPGRGPAVKGDGLREYRDMLAAMRDRVQALIAQGKSLADVVAAKPSASFDERWGHGPVSPDAFVTALYTSLTPPAPKR
jgi:cyclase